MPELVGPRQVSPTVGGEDDGFIVLFGSAEVGNLPNTLFEYFLPIFPLVDFSANADGFDNKTVFFGKSEV